MALGLCIDYCSIDMKLLLVDKQSGHKNIISPLSFEHSNNGNNVYYSRLRSYRPYIKISLSLRLFDSTPASYTGLHSTTQASHNA